MATKAEAAYLRALKRQQIADAKFQAALQHQWGYARAGTKRYDHSGDNGATRKARLAFHKASEATRKALAKMRAQGGSVASNPTYGTAYFVSLAAAVRYYKDYGEDRGDVERKVREGAIHIGKPPLKPGERLGLTDGGKRYTITTSEKNPAKMKRRLSNPVKLKPSHIGPTEARQILKECGIAPGADFHTLHSNQTGCLVEQAKKWHYRKPKNANGSTGRYFYALLERKLKAGNPRSLATITGLLYNKFLREGKPPAEAMRMAKLNAPHYQRADAVREAHQKGMTKEQALQSVYGKRGLKAIKAGKFPTMPNPGKKLRFKDLKVGEKFHFASHSSGMASGPWWKTGARIYSGSTPALQNVRIGSINAEVVRPGGMQRDIITGWKTEVNPGFSSGQVIPKGIPKYRAILTAKPGTLLLGGKRGVVSSWFSTKKMAQDWVYAMKQPNLGSARLQMTTDKVKVAA